MSDEPSEDPRRAPRRTPGDAVEGLAPAALFRAALGDDPSDPYAAQRAADEERRVRAEIEERLPDLELIELLGRGGMGYVYRARQTKLDREVALKVVAPEADGHEADGPEAEGQPDFAERFAREARALARLNHPNLVAVHDYGQDGSFAWLLMEYVEGSNLRDLLRAGRLEPAEALALVPKICDALQYAHDRGVVHRDVKPENILVDGTGGVKIADFGLAKLVGTPAALVSLTGTQQVLGTFRYMAPEQLDRPLEVDHRADIYSLGVVFYEMLTGEIPMGRFDPPSLTSSAPPDLDRVVLRALAREPDRRYQRASEVKSDLESVGRGAPASTAPPRSESARETGSPRLSMQAIVASALFATGLFPFLLLAALLLRAQAVPPGSPPEAAGFQLSMAAVAASVAGLAGTALLAAASAVGFRALRQIAAAWPRLYGAGAATLGAWGGPLVLADAAVLAAAVVVARGASGNLSLPVPAATGLALLAANAGHLVWYRRRFLRRCAAR